MTTVEELLDLIDNNRESEEFVEILDGNGYVEARLRVCSDIWKGIEHRTINSMRAQGDRIQIWLNDDN